MQPEVTFGRAGSVLLRIVLALAQILFLLDLLSRSETTMLLDRHEAFVLPRNDGGSAPIRGSEEVFGSVRASMREYYSSQESKVGVLSHESTSFFSSLQAAVDNADPVERCARYGFSEDPGLVRNPRRIFYGALVADESMELFEIVAAEARGIYSGMVLVESNRTQNYTPRQLRFASNADAASQLFAGLFDTNVQIIDYQKENPHVLGLFRENLQRQQILTGWREMGMGPDDIGLIADPDETFSRDFLRAAQTCRMQPFDYETYRCGHAIMKGVGLGFESSPDCITAEREWGHPDMAIGHCIEGIGNLTPTPRRKNQYGFNDLSPNCKKLAGPNPYRPEGNFSYPPLNAWDFRKRCGFRFAHHYRFSYHKGGPKKDNYTSYSAFHMHNFFAGHNDLRFKYRTFGHTVKNHETKSLEEFSMDLKMMVRCVKGVDDDPDQKWKRVPGGYARLKPMLPIYFHDPKYRRERHALIQKMVDEDELNRITGKE